MTLWGRSMLVGVRSRRYEVATVGAAALAVAVALVMLVSATVAVAAPSAAPLTTQIVNSNVDDACLSTNNGTSVYIATCSGIAHHQWERISLGRLKNKGSGKCLSTNGVDVYTAACSTTTPYHRWTLQPGDSANHKRIQNNETDQCLTANLRNDVYTARCSGIDAHYWWFS